ncbi:J domain-containing protein [Taibaiella soli]|uniref:J domain-containing protein n=1 Tax=Taibaiella soli TaxID=1649169 RepID=A0A2W2AUL8_9BACT|nr:DnaJ domain-containing protein [Taibaiella soli]PZF71378.1 hypothetical protein DN068_18990 [Taibaiella soli]
MSFRNHYQILEISRTASPEEIKSAYRRLSKKYHPDMNGGEKYFEEKFKEIQSAYEVLSDPYRKAVYDDRFNAFRQNPFNVEEETGYRPSRPAPVPPRKHRSVRFPLYLVFMGIIALFRMVSQMQQTNQFSNVSFVQGDLASKANSGELRQMLADLQTHVFAKQDCELTGTLSVVDKEKHLYRLQLNKPVEFLDTTVGSDQYWQTIYAVQVQDVSNKFKMAKFEGNRATIHCTLVACAHTAAEPPVMTEIISKIDN